MITRDLVLLREKFGVVSDVPVPAAGTEIIERY
jgi:hypothetical protein